MQAPPHSFPTGRAQRFADPNHSRSTSLADRYAGPFSFHSNGPRCLLCRPLLTPFQLVVVTVLPDNPHSIANGHADGYAGPSSLHSNRPCGLLCRTILTALQPPCWQLCRTSLTSHQPVVLTVIPDYPYSPLGSRAESNAGTTHSLPTSRADRYA